MTPRHIIASLLLLIVSATCFAETPESLFQRGVEAFRQEDWQRAIASWQEIEQRGWVGGELYHNLGNAYYRIGAIGKSIIYFERARMLMPRDPDLTQNLDLARLATVDRIEAPLRLVVWDWIDTVRDALSLYELSRVVLALGFLAAISVALWIFGTRFVRRDLRLAATLLVILYALGLGWYGWRSALDARIRAVVVETKVDVFSAPDSAATQVFTIHEGTEVRERQSVGGWVHVVLADGRAGWLPNETVERI